MRSNRYEFTDASNPSLSRRAPFKSSGNAPFWPRASELQRRLDLTLHEFSADYRLGSEAALTSPHRLTSYDETCPDLAMRLGATLATLDEALAIAAEMLGTRVFSASG